MGHREWFLDTNLRKNHLRIPSLDLNAAVPVVRRHGFVSFDRVAAHMRLAPFERQRLVWSRSAAVGAKYAVADITARRGRARFEVVVDDVVLALLVAAVHRAVPPVVDHVVYE